MSVCTDLQYIIIKNLNFDKTCDILKETIFPFKIYAHKIPIVYTGDNKNLKYIKDAHTINISNNGFITDKDIKKITLKYCPNITDECVSYLIYASSIKIIMCEKITDTGVKCLKNIEDFEFKEYNIFEYISYNYRNICDGVNIYSYSLKL